MKKSRLPLIGELFCSNCDSFLSYKCIQKNIQLGELKIHLQSGGITKKRYEIVMQCKICNAEKIKIRYE